MRRLLGAEQGSSTIEFLALIPLFILFAMIVWQFTLVGYGLLNTQAAARDGVRFAATKMSSNLTVEEVEEAARKATCLSFGQEKSYYSLDEKDVEVVINSSDAKVTVTTYLHTILLPNKVDIPYTYTVTTPIYDYKYEGI